MALLKRFNTGDSGNTSGKEGNGPSSTDITRSAPPPPPIQSRPVSSTSISTMEGLTEFKNRVQNKLLATLEPTTDMSRKEQLRQNIERVIDDMILEEHITISRPEKLRLHESVCAE